MAFAVCYMGGLFSVLARVVGYGGRGSVIIAQVITRPSLSVSVFYLVTITGKVGCYHKPV